MLLRYPERFKPLNPQSVEMRMLASMVVHRRSMVNEKMQLTNCLRSTLKQYYP